MIGGMSGSIGIVLAAGLGRRYDPTGERLKLLQPTLSGAHVGLPIVVAAARNLHGAVPRTVAVVRPREQAHQPQLHALLSESGCELVVCANAADGMGASLACGIAATAEAESWIVALGDMPGIEADTVAAVADALRAGYMTVAPTYVGRRGHPVGFSARCLSDLLGCSGDEGGRAVLRKYPPHPVAVNDAGILEDVDALPLSS